jgi:hypothetical protein
VCINKEENIVKVVDKIEFASIKCRKKGDWLLREDTYVPYKVGILSGEPILHYVIGQRKGLGRKYSV